MFRLISVMGTNYQPHFSVALTAFRSWHIVLYAFTYGMDSFFWVVQLGSALKPLASQVDALPDLLAAL